MTPEHARILLERATSLLDRGTLVFDQAGPVASYAFVVPIELRDDLADIIVDIEMADDDA